MPSELEEVTRLLVERQAARIGEFVERFSPEARRTIETFSIPPAGLYAMFLRYTSEANPKSFVLDGYRDDSKKIANFAKDLRAAAYGLRFVANLKLPFLDDGSEASDPYEGFDRSTTTDAQTTGIFSAPMPKESRSAFAARVVKVFNLPFSVAEENGAEWKSPFKIPGWFLAQFPVASSMAELHRTLVDDPKAMSQATGSQSATPGDQAAFTLAQKLVSGSARDMNCNWLALDHLAALLDDLADQFDAVAGRLRRGRGRPVAKIERAFRNEFVDYAQRSSGRYLDDLGAELFSMTFQPVTTEVYQRAREKDREPSRKPRATAARQKSAKSR